MKRKAKEILTNWRILVLIFFLLVSFMAIDYQFMDKEGVVINGVAMGSPASEAGMEFDSMVSLTNMEEITYLEQERIDSVSDYYETLNNMPLSNDTEIRIRTDKNSQGYVVTPSPTQNESNAEALGLSVREKPNSNIRLGIELEGGSRIVLKPEKEVSSDKFDLIVENLRNRLNVYGASGTKVSKIKDTFSGESYIQVESPSANKEEIHSLISKQGHFEAKLGNKTAFTGDDISRVFNDPQHSGLQKCGEAEQGKTRCTYRFQVEITEEAATNFFNIAKNLSIVKGQNGEEYLSKKIEFLLDNESITSLNVGGSFKYKKVTTPSITVSGKQAVTVDKAKESGEKEMKTLQALLSTKSLPTELKVVQSYDVTSSKGEELLNNAILIGILAVLAVATSVAFRYKNPVVFGSIFVALVSELLIVLGMASFLKITIDLAAIGGLIAAIGTGVDDQIIITDEYHRKYNKQMNRRKKIKKAFMIILISYFTTLAAMFPLMVAGLKILQGFAFMIILGVTVGVLITRPAYGVIIEKLIK